VLTIVFCLSVLVVVDYRFPQFILGIIQRLKLFFNTNIARKLAERTQWTVREADACFRFARMTLWGLHRSS
jgi:hypothetical protein